MALSSQNILLNIQPAEHPICVELPNGETLHSSHTALLDLPRLPLAARRVHIFQELTNSLLSIGQLCDHGCTAEYNKESVIVRDENREVILEGKRCPKTRLWMVDLVQHHTASTIIHNESVSNQIDFYHAAMGYPVPSTMQHAIEKGYLRFPGLTPTAFKKYGDYSVPTAKGHLDQTRSGIRSTKSSASTIFPTELAQTVLHNTISVSTQPIHAPSSRVHTDLTGRFPITSKRGYQYVMLVYHEDSNYIHVEPMISRHSNHHLIAFQSACNFFNNNKKLSINKARFDNETSADMQSLCKSMNISVEFVPPGNHRTNLSERCIRTFKAHFIAILSGTDPLFPMYLWDELLGQAELTLNLLRESHLNPSISAYQEVCGEFDFNKTPIAPLGTAIVSHDKAAARTSWAPHGEAGFYIGPAMQFYRCYRVYITRTQSVRVTDTLSWHPKHVCMPGASVQENLSVAIASLIDVLTVLPNSINLPATTFIPTLPLIQCLSDLNSIFNPTTTSTDSNLPLATHSNPPTAPIQRVAVSLPVPESAPEQRVVEIDQLSLEPTVVCQQPSAPPAHQRLSRTTSTPSRYLSAVQHATLEVPLHSSPTTTSSPVAPISYHSVMRGEDKDLWEEASALEFDRLLTTSKTMKFVTQLPVGRTAAYYNPQVKVKVNPDGSLKRRVRGTIGGDKVDYPGEVTALTAALSTIKLLLNSVVSEGADWATADITDFYLGTPLPRAEYMRIPMHLIPARIQAQHGLNSHTQKFALVEIWKGIYGLPQAGKLAQDRLILHLASAGYFPTASTPCLFRHASRPVSFTLVVDDFGIKYNGVENLNHLLDTLRSLYDITLDMKGSKYIGININHDKEKKIITLSMPGYIKNALARFGIQKTSRDTNSPIIYTPVIYGASQPPTTDDSAPLSTERIKRLQQIIGVLLYYARCTDSSILTAVNKLGSQQASPTVNVEAAAERLLQYLATWPVAIVTYHASDMHLIVFSDASYLSETSARSRTGGVLFLGSKELGGESCVNGSVESISAIIPSIVASAAEAEYAAVYMNAGLAEGLRNTLLDLGYPQLVTPIFTDNSCAVGLANNTIKQKRSKAMDMRYHWIRDRVQQGHFSVSYKIGEENIADFFTKALPVHKHLELRNHFVSYAGIDAVLKPKRCHHSHQRTIISQ